MVPYTLDANDMRFATAQGFNSGAQFFDYLKDSFDVLHSEGGRMMSVGLHCRLAGRPGRLAALKRFIDYAASHDNVWFAKRIEIADHWRKTHPPAKPSEQPFLMDQKTFVDTYGGAAPHGGGMWS